MSNVDNTLLMQRLSAQLEQHGHGVGNLPPSGGNMEPRVAKLEASVGHIESDIRDIKSDVRDIKRESREDFRLLFGAIIVATLGIVGILARGFHWL